MLQTLIDLSKLEIAQEQDPNVVAVRDMLQASPGHLAWEHAFLKVPRSRPFGLSTLT